MEKINIAFRDVLTTFSLSPEQWLSRSSLQSSDPGIALATIAGSAKRGGTNHLGESVVLDTGHAVCGILRLPETVNATSVRTSHKKQVPEGSVIISRLRPYLKQVAYVPKGVQEMIEGKTIACSTEFYVLTPKGQESIAYLVPWLLSAKVQAIFAKATTGGHHPRFDESLLWGLQIPYQVYEQRNAISRTVEIATLGALMAQVSLGELALKC